MNTDSQKFWYDLVRRLGRGPDLRPLEPEEAWAEYLDAPHEPAESAPTSDTTAFLGRSAGELAERGGDEDELAWLDVGAAFFPHSEVSHVPQEDTEVGRSGDSLLKRYERRVLLRALELTGGDKLAAARLVGVGRSTFYRKLRMHGLAR